MKILKLLFPMFQIFENIVMLYKSTKLNFMESKFLLSLKIWFLSIIIPTTVTMYLILLTILGQTMKYPFLESIWKVWSDFYITGTFLYIEAWRWHIVLLIASFIITFLED